MPIAVETFSEVVSTSTSQVKGCGFNATMARDATLVLWVKQTKPWIGEFGETHDHLHFVDMG